jgi:hypothetical protein
MRALLRAAMLTGAILAGSGVLEATGLPLFSAINEIALKLVAVQSEAEQLRRKGAGARNRLARAVPENDLARRRFDSAAVRTA